ncbi:MAG: DUF1385 domain-containing protein [Clostridia bacterium]
MPSEERDDMNKATRAGGQAVIEGVMMRAGSRMAVAVRAPDGEISLYRERVASLGERYPVLRLPIVRGGVTLIESLSLGIKALMFSANIQAQSEDEMITGRDMGLAVLGGMGLAVALFVLLPTLATSLLGRLVDGRLALNLLEGAIRLALVVGYIAIIGYLRAWERAGFPEDVALDVDDIVLESTAHARCGTSFILMVAVVSVVVFSFFGWPSILGRIVIRLLMLPVVAGIAYEIIRLAAEGRSKVFELLVKPGMWLQRLTTRRPDTDQLEVALVALRGCMIEGDGDA